MIGVLGCSVEFEHSAEMKLWRRSSMGGKATQQVFFAEVEIALWYASLAVAGVALQSVVV